MSLENKIPKTVKLKTYVLTVLLISVIFAGALSYTIGQPYIGDVSEVWVQPPFHEASYIVGVYNSTYYYAKNGTTGNYDWISTNETSVINNAYGNVTNGGTLFIKAGTYYVQGLNPPSNSLTFGEGTATKLIYSGDDSSEGHMEQEAYYSHNVFYMQDKTNIEIAWLEIDGNQSAFGPYTTAPAHQGNGVKMVNVTHSSVHHCYIHDVMRTGVLVRGGVSHGYVELDVDVYNCRFDMCNWDAVEFSDATFCSTHDLWINGTSDVACGVWECENINFYNIFAQKGNRDKGSISSHDTFSFDGSDYTHPTTGCTLTASVFKDFDGAGVLFLNAASNCEVSHCTFVDIKKSVIGESKKEATNNRIISNDFINCTTAISGQAIIGIDSVGARGGWIIDDNTFDSPGNNSNAIYLKDGMGNQVTNNRIYGIYRGIYIATCNNTVIEGNQLFDIEYQAILLLTARKTRVIANTLHNCQYGLYMQSTPVDTIASFNVFDNVTTKVTISGTTHKFFQNIGYVTENSGSQVNGTATTWTIAHGLASTPVFACFSFNATGWTSYKWSADGTNITVTITGTPETAAVLCYWDARTWN